LVVQRLAGRWHQFVYVEEITFTKSKLIEIVNHSKPSIIGLKIIVIFWTLFALVFFINIWLNFIGYINKSTKTYGTVISVMNASTNSYFNNLEILYQGKSYPTKLESSKKYNVGEHLNFTKSHFLNFNTHVVTYSQKRFGKVFQPMT
jgi:hypothetical protein